MAFAFGDLQQLFRELRRRSNSALSLADRLGQSYLLSVGETVDTSNDGPVAVVSSWTFGLRVFCISADWAGHE